MRIFKSRAFAKWASKQRLDDKALLAAVDEIALGLVDADLGCGVVKKRVALAGRGKRGGVRTILAYQVGAKAFFIYGFAKNTRANISGDELKALKLLATDLLNYSTHYLAFLVEAGELIEGKSDG